MNKIYEGPKKLKQWARGQAVDNSSLGSFDNYQLYNGPKKLKKFVGVDGIASSSSGSGLPAMPELVSTKTWLKNGDPLPSTITFDTTKTPEEMAAWISTLTFVTETNSIGETNQKAIVLCGDEGEEGPHLYVMDLFCMGNYLFIFVDPTGEAGATIYQYIDPNGPNADNVSDWSQVNKWLVDSVPFTATGTAQSIPEGTDFLCPGEGWGVAGSEPYDISLKVGEVVDGKFVYDTSIDLDGYLNMLDAGSGMYPISGEEGAFMAMSNPDSTGTDGKPMWIVVNAMAAESSDPTNLYVYISHNVPDEALAEFASLGLNITRTGWQVTEHTIPEDYTSMVTYSDVIFEFHSEGEPLPAEKMIIVGNPYKGTAGWEDKVSDLPAGGTEGQVLTKTTSGEAWRDPETVDIVEIPVDSLYAESFEFNISKSDFERLKAPNAILRLRCIESGSALSSNAYSDFRCTSYNILSGNGANWYVMTLMSCDVPFALEAETVAVIKVALINYIPGDEQVDPPICKVRVLVKKTWPY